MNSQQVLELPYYHDIETIFLPFMPSFACAHFNGEWLPSDSINELIKYSFELQHPLQLLDSEDKKANITKWLGELSKNKVYQPSLFGGNGNEEITYLLDSLLSLRKDNRALYKRWKQKVNGKERDLAVPQKALEELLKGYVLPLIMSAPCHSQCHGGEKGWSAQKSLATHLPFKSVLSFDLSDAFKNIELPYVYDFYHRNMGQIEDPIQRMEVAGFLTTISTVYDGDRNSSVLPQGSPISAALFNRILYPIDELFFQYCQDKKLTYTRWIDDFTISSKKRGIAMEVLELAGRAFPINPRKIFFQTEDRSAVFYLLGHKIMGNIIVPVSREESKNRGEPISLGEEDRF